MILPSNPSSGEPEAVPRILSILWERRITLLSCIAVAAVIAVIGYLNAPARYKSEVILALDVRKLQALPTESVVSPLPQESPVLRTELDIIGSRSMAERVLMQLSKNSPSTARDEKSSRAYVQPGPDRGDLPPARKDIETQKLIDDLMANVRVMNDGRSYTIYIAYYDSDPVQAATVANTFGEAYIDYQIDLQTTATRRVSEWLGERLVSLRTKLEESERQATQFRETSGLVETGGVTLQAQQLSDLNRELTSLRVRLSGAQARLQTALSVLHSSDGLALAEVLASPSIQLLRAEEARVIRAIAEIDQSGALMNPQRPQLTSQLASLKSQIASEITQIVDSLRNEIDVNRKQQTGVEASIAEIESAMAATNLAIVQSGQLDREASANRAIYETYLARYKQTIEQDGIATAEARVISRAMPSQKPTSPNAGLWGLMALIMGTVAGSALAFLQHFTDRSIRSPAALQGKTGLTVIGRIPRVGRHEITTGPGMFSGSASDFHSAVADLQAHIRIAEDKARVIAFTSSADREGKTFVIANLARSLALTGVRSIIIDANLRRPAIGREFSTQSVFHLAQAMNHERSFDDVIQRDDTASVDLIIAHKDDAPPEFILGSRRFAALVQDMRLRYDMVLIDAPSASNGFDLMRIASLSDAVAFVVRKDVADIASIQSAIGRLRAAGIHLSGIVLNGVDRQKRPPGVASWLALLFSGFGRLRFKPAFKAPGSTIAPTMR